MLDSFLTPPHPKQHHDKRPDGTPMQSWNIDKKGGEGGYAHYVSTPVLRRLVEDGVRKDQVPPAQLRKRVDQQPEVDRVARGTNLLLYQTLSKKLTTLVSKVTGVQK